MKYTVRFLEFDCSVEKHHYANGQVALELVASDTANNRARDALPGEPIARATVCLVDQRFDEHETAIKNCAENEGLLDVLISEGVVAPTGREVEAGWNRYPVVSLLI